MANHLSMANLQTPRHNAAKIKAIYTIASQAGLALASELQLQYGLTTPQQLTIQQASHMIDNLKQSLTPTTV